MSPAVQGGSVYGWLWRRLPGNRWAKAAQAVALAAIVVVVLFQVVFPWAENALPFLDVSVEEPDR